MNLTVSTRELQSALRRVAPIIRRSSSVPAIRNIQITATPDMLLRISATSLDLYLTIIIPAVVTEPGSAILPDRTLAKWLLTLPAGDLIINDYFLTNRSALTFSQPGDEDSGNLAVPVLKDDEFPTWTAESKKCIAVLDPEQAAEFRAALVRASTFASRDAEQRPVINAVMTRFSPSEIIMEATDGIRCITTRADIPCLEEFNALIPLSAITHIVRLLPSRGEEIRIMFVQSTAQMILSWPGVEMAFTLQDGRFPDWRVIVPKKFEHTCRVNRSLLLNALRQSQLIFDGHTPLLLELTPDSTWAMLSISNVEIGEYQRKIPVEYCGSEMKIVFNPFLLYESAWAMEQDEVSIQMCSNKLPVLMSDEKSTTLTMPMMYQG